MCDNTKISDTFSVRYQPKSAADRFTMEAKVEAANALVIVEAVNHLAKLYGVKARLLTKALGKGGFARYYQVVVEQEEEHGDYVADFLIKFTRMLFTKEVFEAETLIFPALFADGDEKKWVTERFHLTEEKLRGVAESRRIKKYRTRFYKELKDCKTILAVAFNDAHAYDFSPKAATEIHHLAFRQYIEDLDTVVEKLDDKAQILISKPALLKDDNSKWSGYYQSKPINFTLADNEFKTKAQTGLIKFSTGFAIRCRLKYRESYNENDELKADSYEVAVVYESFIDNKWNLTKAGKKKQADDALPSLFGDDFFK